MKSASIATATLRTHRLHSLMAPGNLSNPANPSSLQITSRLVARGAGGRGEALRYTILRFFRILFLKNVLVPKCPDQARARPHGPGPWAGPILGLGWAHIWAWPGPNMGLAHGPGPWGRARARPGHFGTRTFFRNSILKNPNIVYISEF